MNKEKDMFIRYELVRKEGLYNMYDPRAIQLTGLTFEDYGYVMDNYQELAKKYENEEI